jgi:carboxyl-terminal processing protease
LAESGDQDANTPIGSLKITVQKFYRVNGGSTQLKGVIPDIILPDPYSGIEMGERRDKAALKWDEIPAANYQPVANAVNVAELAALSKKRVAANPTFDVIKESAARIKERENNNVYPLNEMAYKKEMEEASATSKKIEELEKKTTPFEIVNLREDMQKVNVDSLAVAKNADWIKNLKKDIYIFETVNIINDMSKVKGKVTMDNRMKQ